MSTTKKSRWSHLAAVVLVPLQVLLGVPLFAAEAPPAAVVATRHSGPLPAPVVLDLDLPAHPTTAQIARARLFEEPLVATEEPTAADNVALGAALREVSRGGASASALESYLAAHPASPWRASLLTNLGLLYRKTGYITRALAAWEEAWRLGKEQTGAGKALADRAISERVYLLSRLGKVPEATAILEEISGRPMRGSAAEKVSTARQNLAMIEESPSEAIRCGPSALEAVVLALKPDRAALAAIQNHHVGPGGASLAELAALATEVGLEMVAVKRPAGGAVPVPSLVHWKTGHFAAVISERQGRYLVVDSALNERIFVEGAVFEQEGSGYYLVPQASPASSWPPVSDEEAQSVKGTGRTDDDDPGALSCNDPATICCEPNTGPSSGLPRAGVHLMLVSLFIRDTPVGYQPPRGPNVSFGVGYHQRESFQPQVFRYSNLGPKWTFDWLAYITDDPASPFSSVSHYIAGGGSESFENYDETRSEYAPQRISRRRLKVVSRDPIRYELMDSDGSIQVFTQPDGSVVAPRKVLLTERIDPTGDKIVFEYDQDLRMTRVIDAIGQVTTLSYELPGDIWKITRVTDPFGRQARFDYDGEGRLRRITDVIGLWGEISYGADDMPSSLTTPYGVTRFQTWQGAPPWRQRWVEIVDPLGARERVEFFQSGDCNNEPRPEGIPVDWYGLADICSNRVRYRSTYYWDKAAMAQYPRDYSKAQVYHWLHVPGTNTTSGVLESEKKPLESRVWYGYPDQTQYTTADITIGRQPTLIARILDDGTTQAYRYEHNSRGKVLKAVDPVGRTTFYDYAPNDIDLVAVMQLNGQKTDLLAKYTYNDRHQVLTATDAAGQTTRYAYTPNHQLYTVTNAKNETTTYAYDPDGRLEAVTGPVAGATTTYEYDDFGQLRKATAPDGYSVTREYDALDRPVKVTYPDGTYEQTVYDKLDASRHRDRLGRWAESLHDPLRRVVSEKDSAGRTTTYEWQSCRSGCGGVGGGKLAKLIDANGNATRWEYDVQGRMTKEIRANNAEYNYTYETTTSRLKSTRDPKTNVKTFTYGRDNSLLGVTYAEASGAAETPDIAYTYDPAYGRVQTLTDGTGTTTYAYHPVTSPPAAGAGQLQRVDGPLDNDTIEYAYDQLGRVTSRQIGSSANTQTQHFDTLGRLDTLTNPLGTFVYAYEGVTGRPASLTYPNGQQTTYTYYDNLGDHRLQEIHNKKPGGATLSKFNYTYDVASNIRTWRQQTEDDPAKVYEFGYDQADQLTAALLKSTDPTPQLLKRYYYAYDPAGNRTAEQNDDAVTGATYNNMNQLVSRQPGGALVFKGTVDEPATVTVGGTPAQVTSDNRRFEGQAVVPSGAGNVAVTATDYNGNTRTNTYQVNQSGAGKSFAYDANGNLTSDGTRTFEWDADNRLVAVSEGTRRTEFIYHGLSWRVRIIEKQDGVAQSNHRYVWCGSEVCEERDATGTTVMKGFFGGGVHDASTNRFYATDHLGSIRELMDATGTLLLARYDYDLFGRGTKLLGSEDADFGFTGHFTHYPRGLVLALHRAYDADLGRWISEDPSRSNGPNLYTYVRNRPLSLRDPLGLWAAGAGGGVAGAVGGPQLAAFGEANCSFVFDGQGNVGLMCCYGAGFGSVIPLGAVGGPQGLAMLCPSCQTICDMPGMYAQPFFGGSAGPGAAGGYGGSFTSSTYTHIVSGGPAEGAGFAGGAVGGWCRMITSSIPCECSK